MKDKISETLELFLRHFPLLSAITLAIFFPLNLVIAVILPGSGLLTEMEIEKSATYAEIIANSFCAASLIHALSRVQQGKHVSIGESLRIGFLKWPTLFLAEFIASLFVLLGLIAFIVPGIVLAVRYSLLAPVVVLEKKSVWGPRQRSAQLTEGYRWEIFYSFIVLMLLISIPMLILTLCLELFGFAGYAAADLIQKCIFNILTVSVSILLFLYYSDAIDLEKRLRAVQNKAHHSCDLSEEILEPSLGDVREFATAEEVPMSSGAEVSGEFGCVGDIPKSDACSPEQITRQT